MSKKFCQAPKCLCGNHRPAKPRCELCDSPDATWSDIEGIWLCDDCD